MFASIFARTEYIFSEQVANMLPMFLWKSLFKKNCVFLHVQSITALKIIYVYMYKNIYNNFRIGGYKIQVQALIFEK